jgi:hypothetical protein
MKNRKYGTRYPLILYHRVMSRLWVATLVLGLLLLLIWGWEWYYSQPLLRTKASIWLPAAGLVLLVFTLFAFFGRNMAYVQAHRDHLRLVTPFLRTNISYRRVRSAHPVVFQKLFPPKEASWAQRQLLTPFYGKTVVVVELSDFPLSPGILRLFLAPQMFSPRSKGLVFLVSDWMAFSTELDSFRGTWMQNSDRTPQRLAPARR